MTLYSVENSTDSIAAFLSFLDEDILVRRDCIVPLNPALWHQACQLTSDIEIDLNANLEDDE
jgi:hypothetical protein